MDAHSKWLEVMTVPSTSAQCTIQKLHTRFATHGIPEIIVSDNGTGFISGEFQAFIKRNGIRHVTSAPYHPASNGLAERAVQTFKSGLQKAPTGDREVQLARFLFKYRNTPHTTTGTTPAELLMGRKPRTHLSLLHPNLATRVHNQQKSGHDQHAKAREIKVDDPVFVRDFTTQAVKWLPGVVTEQKGSLLFFVQLSGGRIVRCHIDHIRVSTVEEPPTLLEDDILPPLTVASQAGEEPQPLSSQPVEEPQLPSSQPVAPLRHSTRVSRPPDRLFS